MRILRREAELLEPKFVQSMSSELAADSEGRSCLTSFPKPGVVSCELDGDEIDTSPMLLHYTAAVMHTLPQVINHYLSREGVEIASSTYGTKLALTLGGGSKYPKHVDNAGLPDLRKLTLILYLNPDWRGDGGELRVWGRGGLVEDIEPFGDKAVIFWSDQIVHEVLANMGESNDPASRRFALTLWLVSSTEEGIADPTHPLADVRLGHFLPTK